MSNSLIMANNVVEDEQYFDELYDEPEIEKEENNKNRSVILHLASQLTRNMDISRLSLPASLCERRSILETYSDYFSRTHLWCDIAQLEMPEERMIACLKWYLSTFNASRKSKLAKKPYNPILGEVFKCKFKVLVNNQERVISYISEQVSHHPPILAFHVEDDAHQMSLNCQIYLKSKFLGLSVSIDMVGEARLKLPQRDNEEYIITFPTAFCNSIYTTPWLELGGKSKISCTKTGYAAKINFRRQGYFFGQRDKIEASVFRSCKKDLFLTIKGNWNGLLMSKYTSESREREFMDISKIPLVKSIVLPRSNQCDFESRKVWENVTNFLKINDLTAAIEAKIKIEQEQRNQLSCRIRTNTVWEPRHFRKVGDTFEFYK